MRRGADRIEAILPPRCLSREHEIGRSKLRLIKSPSWIGLIYPIAITISHVSLYTNNHEKSILAVSLRRNASDSSCCMKRVLLTDKHSSHLLRLDEQRSFVSYISQLLQR